MAEAEQPETAIPGRSEHGIAAPQLAYSVKKQAFRQAGRVCPDEDDGAGRGVHHAMGQTFAQPAAGLGPALKLGRPEASKCLLRFTGGGDQEAGAPCRMSGLTHRMGCHRP